MIKLKRDGKMISTVIFTVAGGKGRTPREMSWLVNRIWRLANRLSDWLVVGMGEKRFEGEITIMANDRLEHISVPMREAFVFLQELKILNFPEEQFVYEDRSQNSIGQAQEAEAVLQEVAETLEGQQPTLKDVEVWVVYPRHHIRVPGAWRSAGVKVDRWIVSPYIRDPEAEPRWMRLPFLAILILEHVVSVLDLFRGRMRFRYWLSGIIQHWRNVRRSLAPL